MAISQDWCAAQTLRELIAQMQRLETMAVVPDLVGTFEPEVELVVSARGMKHEAGGGHIPGDKIPPENVRHVDRDNADVADTAAAARRSVRSAPRYEALHARVGRPRCANGCHGHAHRQTIPTRRATHFSSTVTGS